MLEDYLNYGDNIENELNKLKNLLLPTYWYSIFVKIINILNENPLDVYLIRILFNAIKYIIATDLKEFFAENKFCLSQIEQLTPQALTVLSDNASWPNLSLMIFGWCGWCHNKWLD